MFLMYFSYLHFLDFILFFAVIYNKLAIFVFLCIYGDLVTPVLTWQCWGEGAECRPASSGAWQRYSARHWGGSGGSWRRSDIPRSSLHRRQLCSSLRIQSWRTDSASSDLLGWTKPRRTVVTKKVKTSSLLLKNTRVVHSCFWQQLLHV